MASGVDAHGALDPRLRPMPQRFGSEIGFRARSVSQTFVFDTYCAHSAISRSIRHFVTEWEGYDVGLLDADPNGGAHRWVATYTGTGPKVAMQELAAVGDAGT
jgi:hypothetical protein